MDFKKLKNSEFINKVKELLNENKYLDCGICSHAGRFSGIGSTRPDDEKEGCIGYAKKDECRFYNNHKEEMSN